MKKFILFAGYLLSVAIVFFVLDFFAGFVFDRYLFINDNEKLKLIYEGGGGEDIAILGASRAAHHYVPSVFSQELGMSCYNYGMDGCNIFNQYFVAHRILEDAAKKPKIILLEVAYFDIEDSPGWNYEKLSHLDVLYNKDEIVKELKSGDNKARGLVLHYVNSYRYNSKILGLIRAVIHRSSKEDTNKGYKPLYKEWKKDIDTIDDIPLLIHKNKEKYLRSLIAETKEAGVDLFVYYSPDYRTFKYRPTWRDTLACICAEYNVPFIIHDHDDLFMTHKEWFNEPFHLNDKGAREYSTIVANEIKTYLDLE